MRLRRRKVVYGCGNCRESFKTEAELRAHHPCPLYLLEKELAERDARILRLLREAF